MNAVVAPVVAEKVVPTAQASPDGSADSPVTAVLGSDPLGPGATDRAVPFQCRVRETGTGLPPMVCRASPVAQMSVALAALILSTEISPAGLATIDQAVPFQCSKALPSRWAPPPWPCRRAGRVRLRLPAPRG
jgi:hypothetical protein